MKRYLTLSVLISTTALISLSATTYVMMSDSALTDQAELIVVGRVLNRQTGFSDRCVTRYQVLVERILTGQSSADQIEVDVLGGENRDGEVLFLPGSPTA